MPLSTMNRLAENIKLIRKQKWKLSQDRFAVLLNSSRSKINSYENSGVEPSISFMVKLQQLTGISVAEIYGTPIPIDSIPPEPLEEENNPDKIGTPDSQMAVGIKSLANFEEMLHSRFTYLESRISKIEQSIGEEKPGEHF